MPAYMNQKLREIETHSKRLYEREDFTGLGLAQEYSWVSQAVDVLRNQIAMICEKASLVDQVKEIIELEKSSEIAVKQIETLLE